MEFFKQGDRIELSKTEQKLLRLLTANAGLTLTRDTLVDRIWTDGAEYVEENALSVTVKRLRDKLDAGEYIKNNLRSRLFMDKGTIIIIIVCAIITVAAIGAAVYQYYNSKKNVKSDKSDAVPCDRWKFYRDGF